MSKTDDDCTRCHGKGETVERKTRQVKSYPFRGTAFGMGYGAVTKTEEYVETVTCPECGGSGKARN